VWVVREVSWSRCRTRDICGVDRRCGRAVYSLMMRLVEKGLARRFKKGTYIIERRAVEEVFRP
jgi:predicted transcriptional regulator of viral defense system